MLLVPGPHWAGPESIWESAHGLQGSSAGRYKQGMSVLGDNILPFVSLHILNFGIHFTVVAVLYLLTLQLKKEKHKEEAAERPADKKKINRHKSVASMLPLL